MVTLNLLCTIFFLYTFSGSAADNSCAGGYPDGTTVDKGAYWYQCQSGQIIPKGCLTEDGQNRINIGDSFDSAPYRMQCVLDSSGKITLIYKSCLHNGKQHEFGEEWEDGKSYYKCDKDGQFPKIVPSGCLDNGRRVGLNKTVVKEQSVYICSKDSTGQLILTIWGCMGKDGKEHQLGENFNDNKIIYSCMMKHQENKIYLDSMGCIHDDQHLRADDMVTRNDVIYKCEVNGEKTGLVPFACVGNEEGRKSEKRLGCFWVEGQAPFVYEMTCKHDDGSNTAVKVRTKCVYKLPEGSFVVEPGCYRVTKNVAVGCLKGSWTADGNIETKLFQIDANGNVNAPSGLSKC